MQIPLTADQELRLSLHAQAAGYQNVESFLAAQIHDLASQPTADELPSVDESTARALIDQGEEDLAAGRVRDMHDALTELGNRRGYAAE